MTGGEIKGDEKEDDDRSSSSYICIVVALHLRRYRSQAKVVHPVDADAMG